jgi:hypothetical protein
MDCINYISNNTGQNSSLEQIAQAINTLHPHLAEPLGSPNTFDDNYYSGIINIAFSGVDFEV